ncbi:MULTISPECIES: hypothetical protein [Catellatospora]|uniref:TrbC/VIRB2 family protein n=2 Tax=Catellatospora TaxID=53365 RepID=A0A8J3KSU2_9ACTN|nr:MULTISPECIES: hypothetical protein [Catellatospora]RKE08646.1 hypothetical protein C8E86_3503 [Catellatospora citrea]GIF92820.1 hypothetical protein Cch02nite_62640 [Catellatospora chokoriensis]GIG02541.1 hypothetical protein Cci01nite_76340 [Catellatospora citrea]
MIAMELVQAAWNHATPSLGMLADEILAAPGDPAGGGIATNDILTFFATKISPILLAILGVIFIGRASKGEVSKVLTSSAIAIIGVAFIVGAGALLLVGENLIDIMFE